MRATYPFNENWLYWADDVGNHYPDSAFEPITLPYTNKTFPHHNFDNREYGFVSTYRKRFTLPEPRNGRRIYLDFDGAMAAAMVIINGHTFLEHRGGYVPFSFDITDYVVEDGDNLLIVKLDSSERADIPPFGYEVDYLSFGGIYRDVWLRYVPECHIKDVFVRTIDVLTDKPRVEVDIKVKNQANQPYKVQLHASINEGKIQANGVVDEVGSQDIDVNIPAQSEQIFTIRFDALPKIELWSLENPARYGLHTALHIGADYFDDNGAFPFGFCEAYFSKEDGKFYLNGEALKLRGLNRHQTYPYIGAAASARLQRRDADIVKYELGCNIVRTSHYPQSPHFLDRCDEIGLLVFEEIPGWQHIGDAGWQALSLRDLRSMIERDRNHPSIIMWGVRINESQDNSAFYEETNTVAHELDPTRQTGGVRYIRESEFLEDVFTYNDFSNTILEPRHLPQLVTEYNGHMFPAKTWDNEERLIEHALRHAHIQDLSYGMDNLAGAIGWCAFDYNTHREFGSGDRMCYHGVTDIFRLPKWAAYVYASQVSPAARAVLKAATLWTVGDRSAGGNDPLWVFSNCDEIEVTVGDSLLGRFLPDRETFPHLPHAPFKVTGLNMQFMRDTAFGDLHIVGYVDGKEAARQSIAGGAIPYALTLEVDDTELRADGMDMTRVVFKIVDKYGNPLPYVNQVVSFDMRGEGPDGNPLAYLIGEKPFALMGGQAALYLRARHHPGVVTMRASTPRLEPATITVTLK